MIEEDMISSTNLHVNNTMKKAEIDQKIEINKMLSAGGFS
jgi:hypothetical protein